ncbi:MAG: ABC transporter ATP-binding protein [candidate division WOR-3 bacterium]
MLKINSLTKTFGGLKAVDNITIDFRPGKVTSLIGPNGAGKTTLFNLISGFLKPDKGEIVLEVGSEKIEDGRLKIETGSQKLEVRIDKLKPYEIARLGIGRVFQDVRVFKKLNCVENVVLGKKDIFGENPVHSLIFAKKVKALSRKSIEEAEEKLSFVGLLDKKMKFAEDLSFGEQKLLSLARLIYGDYNILLLDEPTAGVNPVMIDKILDLIKKLAKEMNKMVIVIEHNMNVVYQISDWVYFMNEGQITAFGKPDDVLGNIEVRRIYIGL